MNKKNFLLICNDTIGKQMAGPAIRCVEMALALAPHYDVTLLAPSIGARSFAEFALLEATKEVVQACATRADFVLIQGDALSHYPFLKKIEGVLIADLYCPIPLEYHQSSSGVSGDIRMTTTAHNSRVLSDQLCFADYFLCASEKQRDFWLGALALTGRINGLRWPEASHANIDELIAVVPFGMPGYAPEKNGAGLRERFNIPKEDFVAIWGGGVYQWFDPLTIIRAIHRLTSEGQRVHLVFMGVKHPNPGIHQHDMCGEAIKLAEELGLTDRFVHFNFGWTDYDHRQNYFLEADVGVSAHFDNPETRFSFRTRMLDYLWCGLPIIATKGDVFGQNVAERQLGVAVDFEDVEGWVAALSRLKVDMPFRQACKANVADFAGQLTWPSIMEGFMRKMEAVSPAPDRKAVRRLMSASTKRRSLIHRVRQAYAQGGASFLAKQVLRRAGRLLKAG